MVTIEDYGEYETEWCPGCGNFYILKALKTALVKLDIRPNELVLVSGIGQAAKLPHYLKCNVFNGLHGRALSPATGIKIANHDLTVITVGGDGDGYGEGGNHLIHTIRRNPNITTFIHNNQIYALTKGQASPTSEIGVKTHIQSQGVFESQMNPLAMAISLDCSFVARAYAREEDHLINVMVQAINHRGYALVDILQPCISFNKLNTFKWYNERVYKLENEGYVPDNKIKAFEKALEWGDKIPIGIFYRKNKSTFEDGFEIIKNDKLINLPQKEEIIEEIINSYM